VTEKLKPARSAGDILRAMAERAKGRLPEEPEAKPLPLPPADAPLPPVPFHERVPGEDDE
jgi:hypothetical protein